MDNYFLQANESTSSLMSLMHLRTDWSLYKQNYNLAQPHKINIHSFHLQPLRISKNKKYKFTSCSKWSCHIAHFVICKVQATRKIERRHVKLYKFLVHIRLLKDRVFRKQFYNYLFPSSFKETERFRNLHCSDVKPEVLCWHYSKHGL